MSLSLPFDMLIYKDLIWIELGVGDLVRGTAAYRTLDREFYFEVPYLLINGVYVA